MRTALALLVLISASAAHATELSWRVEKFASEFWFIDQVSDWMGDHHGEPYKKELQAKRKFDAAVTKALEGYAAVRQAHASDEKDSAEPEIRNPIRSMFP